MIRPDLADLPAYVPGARNELAVKLSSNELAEGPLPAVEEAMVRAVAGINRYPDMGALGIRRALATHLGVAVAQVAVGTGSSALCQQLVVLATQPRDEVVFPWRSFEAYPIFTRVAGATPVPVALTSEHGLDLPAMAEAVTERTKLIFVCNPNNPTGTTITTGEFAEFMHEVPPGVLVALDEAYFEYNRAADTPVATEEVLKYPNVVGLRTFSKAYGLAGARIGYAFGPEPIIEALNKVAVPFSVSSIAQVAATASLAAGEELRRRVDGTVAQRELVAGRLAPYGVPASQANFIWIPAERVDEAPAALAERIAAEGVLVRAFPEGIRVTVTNEAESAAFLAAWEAVAAGAR